MELTYTTTPTFVMLVGTSYSGKSFLAERLARNNNTVVMSSDCLRLELYGSEEDQNHNHELFVELHRRIKQHLQCGYSVVYDATNLSSKRRKAFLDELKHIQCNKVCIVVVAPLKVLKRRHKKRQRVVPWDVVENQIKKFNCPDISEGWDKVMPYNSAERFEYIGGYVRLYYELFKSFFIKHDNPHHTKTIGCHMLLAAKHYIKNYHPIYNKSLITNAVLFHDIGKPFCKTFKNARGETTKTAHYYGHENVSAYLWLAHSSIFNDTERLTVASLINWHMKPYLLSEKKYEKFCSDIAKQIDGPIKINMLKHVHECDMAAH